MTRYFAVPGSDPMQTHGFDPWQTALIATAQAAGWTEVTETWPPAAPSSPETLIATQAFIRRFTQAEQTALFTSQPAWAWQIAAAPVVDVTATDVVTALQAAVAAGTLTSARMTQVLTLQEASP